MPTYEYECRECGHSFEVSQNMSDDPLKDCPVCGKSIRRIIFGGSGVIFKGSGFYVNDAKGSKSTAKPVSKEGGAASDAAGSADTSADKKSGVSSDGNTAKTGSDAGTEKGGTAAAAAKSTGAST